MVSRMGSHHVPRVCGPYLNAGRVIKSIGVLSQDNRLSLGLSPARSSTISLKSGTYSLPE